jgi:hypothetical protein
MAGDLQIYPKNEWGWWIYWTLECNIAFKINLEAIYYRPNRRSAFLITIIFIRHLRNNWTDCRFVNPLCISTGQQKYLHIYGTTTYLHYAIMYRFDIQIAVNGNNTSRLSAQRNFKIDELILWREIYYLYILLMSIPVDMQIFLLSRRYTYIL